MRRPKGPLTSALAGLLLSPWQLLACSRATIDERVPDAPIAECEAFLTAYEQCLETLGPRSIAQARVEQTRASFDAQLGKGPAVRETLRNRCVTNQSQLGAICRGAPDASFLETTP
jgi:hypothetical protein